MSLRLLTLTVFLFSLGAVTGVDSMLEVDEMRTTILLFLHTTKQRHWKEKCKQYEYNQL